LVFWKIPGSPIWCQPEPEAAQYLIAANYSVFLAIGPSEEAHLALNRPIWQPC